MNPNDFLNKFDSLLVDIKGVRLPEVIVEEKYKKEVGLTNKATNYQFLRGLVSKGFKNLKFEKNSEKYNQYGERVKYELGMLEELGFVDYILIVWDVIRFCNENNIATGLGRGSAAGSLVLYLIGVTKVDPLKYGLFFERFISKIRAKKYIHDGITYLDGALTPDIDSDICFFRRNEVINYIKEKYKGKTCKILTLNSLSGKLLIKELGKIVGNKDEQEMTGITALIPKLHGLVEDLDKAYEKVPQFKKWCDDNKNVYEIAIKLKDLIKNKSNHPSGFLVSFDNLEEICPTELTSDKEIVSSYDMNWVSMFSLKLDILGLRCVSVIDDICKSLKINPDDVNLNDESIYRALQDFRTPHGIFQLETDATFRATQKIKPRNLKELAAVLAIARPGAMQFIDQYASYINTGTAQNVHPFFDDVLKDTGFLPIYQEQLMKMLNKIGFTLDEAETCRKIVGKKLVEKVKEWEEKIKNKVIESKLDPEIGNIIWKILQDSAFYSFNFSHAISYASISAITLYLKFNYPQQFFLSLLKMTKHEPDSISEISKIHKEMASFNIELLPPSLTKSQMDFSIEGKNIRFGLSSIKGISEKTMAKMDNFRRENANKFELFESAGQAGLSIAVLAALIQAGTLDELTTLKNDVNNRSKLVYEAQVWNLLTDKEKKFALTIGEKYGFSVINVVRALNTEIKDEKSKPIIKESRMGTIKKNSEKFKELYIKSDECQKFNNWSSENSLIGYSIKYKLIDIFKEKLSSLIPINQLQDIGEKERVNFIGVVIEGKSGVSKGGSKYMKFDISDETGNFKVMIFNRSLEECKDLNGHYPTEKSVVIVKGTKMGEDVIFADTIAVQQNHIIKLKKDEQF